MLKKRWLENCKLYLILDAQVNSYEQLFEIAKKSIKSGVDIVQLRDKFGTAKNILAFTKRLVRLSKGRVPVIVNDRVDILNVSGASGVHLGQDDLSIDAARSLVGKMPIVGISCQTLKQAKKAEEQGADYIGFGSVFKTLTKPERDPMDLRLLEKVAKNINIPVFAIGGITLGNIKHLRSIGVRRIAVCRAICEEKDTGVITKKFSMELSL